MTQPGNLVNDARKAMPSDNELIMGTVTSGNPLTIATRGGTVTNAGRLSTAEIMTGGTVAMIREGATYLALGQVIGADGVGGLGITQIVYAEATVTLLLTAVDQPVPGMSVTVTTTNPNAMCLCFWTTEYITVAANTSTSNCQLYLDGVAQSGQGATFRADAISQRAVLGTFNWFPAGAPGSHTIAAQGRTTGGAGLVNINNSNSNLLVVVIE